MNAPVVRTSPPSIQARSDRLLIVASLILIVLIGLALRLFQSGRLALHYDEAWTQERATGRG